MDIPVYMRQCGGHLQAGTQCERDHEGTLDGRGSLPGE